MAQAERRCRRITVAVKSWHKRKKYVKMIMMQQLTQLQQIVKMVHVVEQVLRYEMENAFQHMRV